MAITLTDSGHQVKFLPEGVIETADGSKSQRLTVERFLNILARLITIPNNRRLPEVEAFMAEVRKLQPVESPNPGHWRLSTGGEVETDRTFKGSQTVTDYLLSMDRIRPLHEFLSVGWSVLTADDLNVIDCRPSFIEFVRNA